MTYTPTLGGSPATPETGPRDAVAVFERHRAELNATRRLWNIAALVIFALCLGLSIWVSQFYPDRLAAGLPRIFEYFGTIMPDLQWDVLFEGRGEDGRAVPGSLTFWYTDFWTYITLIFETILMAITATLIGAAVAFVQSFPAAANLAPNSWVYWVSRRFLEICRGIPEILLALVFVFMIGITWAEKMAYGVVPQVAPNFFSYAMLRFEINVRASSIIGFVGAGGIGQELNRVISFYSDDRVAAVLVLIVLTVTIIDLISERIRLGYIGRENFQ